MRGNLLDCEKVILLAAALPEDMAVAHVHRGTSLQVGQAEIDPPVTAIGCPEQQEQRLVLVYGKKLPVAKRHALGREIERHYPDFGKIRFRHPRPSLK